MMKKQLLSLLLVMLLFSQVQLRVYVNQAGNKFNHFEKELIQDIIKLHNGKSKTNYKIEFKKYGVFAMLFDILNQEKNNSLLCGINSISITKERQKKYQFSSSYFVSKVILLSKHYQKLHINAKTRISYTEGTLNDKVIKLLSKSHRFIAVPYQNFNIRYEALLKGKDDYGVGDYVDSWIYDMNLVKLFDEFGQDHYGIIFPKHSRLAKELDKTVRYYIKSPAYYKLVRKHFGKEAANFVKQNL